MKTSPLQMETMVTFMEEHGDLNKPTPHSRGKLENLKRWEDLTALLNSDGSGDSKSLEKWKKVWSDFKNNTKKKAARLHRAASGTGGGPAIFAKLSVLEHRVLNLIGIQVATGLAVEEAGFSQNIPIEFGQMSQIATEESAPVIFDSQVEENVELWNQPSSSHITPPLLTTPLPNEENETVEGREDMHQHLPRYRVPEVQPALSGQTATQASVTGSPHRVSRRSPRGVRQRTPQRLRRSPRRLIRPARSEDVGQHFLNSDRQWRQFKIEQHQDCMELKREQHRDYMELKKEQLRIREMELVTQREWQVVVKRGLDVIETIANNYRRDN